MEKLIGWFFGFRKLTIMLLLLWITVGFRMLELINGAQFVELLKATTIAFFGANVSEHIANQTVTWFKRKKKETISETDSS